MREITPKIEAALAGISSKDGVTSLVSWGRLQRAGLATPSGDGRFLSFRLTPQAQKIQESRK